MRIQRNESGIAMITAIMVTTIVAGLTTVALSNSSHSDRTSQRGRNWTVALQTADSGVQRTLAYMQATGATPGPTTGATADGTYVVNVTALGRNRYQIDSTGTVGAGAGLATSRSVRVVIGPPKSFNYALFSNNDVDTKNNNYVQGDVWANGNVTVEQNDTVDGSATSATGWIAVNHNGTITGDAVSGGYDPSTGYAINLGGGSTIGGTAKAESTSPGCADDPTHLHYSVYVGGSISGAVTAWGSKLGGGSTGTFSSGVCLAAPAPKTIPTFTYNAANYNPTPVEFSDPSSFNAWLSAGNKNNLSGTYFVHGGGSGDAVDLGGVTITGDTTIIADAAPINGSNGISAANSNDKVLVLASYYQPASGSACTDNGGNPGDCAIGIKNNFQPQNNTATLLYAPNGPVSFKNNADFDGAVYANNIVLKNNLQLVYDARVDQVVGFGPVTLQTESWIETT
jgi:hypothetical protein